MPQIEIYPDNYPLDKNVVLEITKRFSEKLKVDLDNKIIEIKFVDDTEMRSLNCKFRNIDATTDVLSFPQTPNSSPWQIFGTIVISPVEAGKRGEEIEQLILHGLLHLSRYDHETSQDAWDTAAQIIGHIM